MPELTENYSWMTDTHYMGPAHVVEIDDSGKYVRLQIENNYETSEIRARMAISEIVNPGDTVLVTGDNPDNIYVIGILEQNATNQWSANRIILEDGAHAIGNRQSLKVFSRKRELLFEYDEKKGKAKINLEYGDIEFLTPNGSINFAAGKGILLNGQTVGITSRAGAVIGSTDSEGNINSSLSVQNGELNLDSQSIGIMAQKGNLNIKDTTLTGSKVNANLGFVKFIIDRIETSAKTVKSTAKNIYQTVEELCQFKSGRMRTIVKNTFHLKSKKTMQKSDEDFKIRAEKIHLG